MYHDKFDLKLNKQFESPLFIDLDQNQLFP